jgi:hypothetical protein
MSRVTDLRDAIVTHLNAESFSQTFTAVGKWVPRMSLEELSTLAVTVRPSPNGTQVTRYDRGSLQYETTMEIGVRVKYGSDRESEADEYEALLEEIAESLMSGRLATLEAAMPMSASPSIIHSETAAEEDGVFLGIVSATYRMKT